MKKSTKLRLFGGAVLIFNLWLIGRYNLSGIPVLLLTFGFAIGFEFLVVRPSSKEIGLFKLISSNTNSQEKRYNPEVSQCVLETEFEEILPEDFIYDDYLSENSMIDVTEKIKEDHKRIKHSGWGIVSFIISLIIGISMLSSFIFTVRVIYFNPGVDEQTVIHAAVRFMFLNIAWIIFDIVPIGLGIIGLFQKEKEKIFSILGIVISLTTIFGIIILIMVVKLLQ